MFTVCYSTHEGVKKSISAIDKQYIIFIFNQLLQAIDLEKIEMIDGFTGVVLYSWKNGKFQVIDEIDVSHC